MPDAGTAEGRPVPIALDPCAGLGVGTRLHFLGTRSIDSPGNQGGDLERAAYDLVDRAIGDGGDEVKTPGERSGVPLGVLEAENSRIAWTSEWDTAGVAFPKPLMLAIDTARSSAEGVGGGATSNGWLYVRDARMVRQMGVNNRGGVLQWSRQASYWLRENYLSPLPGTALGSHYQGCLTPVGASLHVTAAKCTGNARASGGGSAHGAGGGGGGQRDVADADADDVCDVAFEYSLYFRAGQRCSPLLLAEKARRAGAPNVRVVIAKGLSSGLPKEVC